MNFIRSLLSRHAACITLICAPASCTMQGSRRDPIFKLPSHLLVRAPHTHRSDLSTPSIEGERSWDAWYAVWTSNRRH